MEGPEREMKAYLLAGGKGSRLGKIGEDTPKAMLQVRCRPLLEHQFDLVKSAGITDIVLAIGYLAHRVQEYVGDGSRFGLKVSYLVEKEPLGTAGGLRFARLELTETFVMMNADELKDVPLREMIDAHRTYARAGVLGTVALTRVDDPTKFGVVRMKDDRIVEFLEKPENPPTNLINAGLYVLEPGVIDEVPRGASSIERDIFPILAQRGQLSGYPFTGQWLPTDTVEKYESANVIWRGLGKRS